MKAAILAVGDELFAPGRVESNSVFLTEELAKAGIPVRFRAVVGDDETAIMEVVRHALSVGDLVFLSGGLGPTADDVTRDAVARALSLEMELDAEWLERIRERFSRRGIEMAEANRKQAMVPKGAELLSNRRGTAPGLWIPVENGKTVILLPGPPAELALMFDAEVSSRLAERATDTFYDVRKLWVVGLAESVLDERIYPFYSRYEHVSTTILASRGTVEIRLTAAGPTVEEAAAANEELAVELRGLLGVQIYSEREQELEEVVGELLTAQSKRLATAESLTGGLIAHRVTDVPGSSHHFDEGFVTYSNASKTSALGVPAELFESVGAVSEDVARHMASGARQRSGADLAVAVTGIAGPTGSSPDKPVGLVYIALASERETRVEKHVFPGDRIQIKRWCSQAALNMVRLALLGM